MFCGNFRLLCTYVCGQIHDTNMECRKSNKQLKNLTIGLDWTEEETVCDRCVDKLLKYFTDNFKLSLIKLDKYYKTLNISWEGKGY